MGTNPIPTSAPAHSSTVVACQRHVGRAAPNKLSRAHPARVRRLRCLLRNLELQPMGNDEALLHLAERRLSHGAVFADDLHRPSIAPVLRRGSQDGCSESANAQLLRRAKFVAHGAVVGHHRGRLALAGVVLGRRPFAVALFLVAHFAPPSVTSSSSRNSMQHAACARWCRPVSGSCRSPSHQATACRHAAA